MRYRCLDCNFRFTGIKPKQCPWCSSNNIVPEETAEELVRESFS